ncbi:hypothetical protein JST97_05920 [bacterium]|nr:hypothetical protein [bacterium]
MQIPSTLIASNQPLNIDSDQSVPYFSVGSFNVGAAANGTIFSVAPTILAWNFQASTGWTFFAGLFGPALTFNLTVEGSTNGDQLALNVSRDKIQGGLLFGVQAGLIAQFAIRQASLHWVKDGWHSHFETTWNEKLNVKGAVTFDLISIILSIVVKILDEEKKDTVLQSARNLSPKLTASYGIFDSVSDGFRVSQTLSVNPKFSLPLNLVPLIPGLAQINEGLEALLGGLFLGPTVGVAIPAVVKINSVEVGGSTYTIDSSSGTVLTGTRSGTGQDGDRIKFNMDRSPGIDIALGFAANVSVLKLFSLGGSISTDLLKTLGVDPAFTTTPFSRDNQIGSSVLAEAAQQLPEMAEVIFELPQV